MEAPRIRCRYAHEIAARNPRNARSAGKDPLVFRNEKGDIREGSAESHKDSPSHLVRFKSAAASRESKAAEDSRTPKPRGLNSVRENAPAPNAFGGVRLSCAAFD